MTLVGKIFTMLILIMSVAFMAFSVMVFATHKNWKDYVTNPTTGLQKQLELAKTAKADADSQIQRLKEELKMEQAARTGAIAVLTSRNVQLEQALSAQTAELNTLSANHTTVAATAKQAQERLATLEDEVNKTRDSLRKTEEDLEKQVLAVVKLTDDLNQAITLRDSEKEKNTQAVLQIAQMKMVMDSHNLSIDALVSHIPPKVEGIVLEVSDKDLIEISIGKDDGLKEGHSLDVYRGNTFVGRILIRRTAPDRAVGQIIKELQRGQIKRGDRVSTKLS